MSGSSLFGLQMRDSIDYIVQLVNSNDEWLAWLGRQLGENAIDVDEAPLTHVVHPCLDVLDLLFLTRATEDSIKHLRQRFTKSWNHGLNFE